MYWRPVNNPIIIGKANINFNQRGVVWSEITGQPDLDR